MPATTGPDRTGPDQKRNCWYCGFLAQWAVRGKGGVVVVVVVAVWYSANSIYASLHVPMEIHPQPRCGR